SDGGAMVARARPAPVANGASHSARSREAVARLDGGSPAQFDADAVAADHPSPSPRACPAAQYWSTGRKSFARFTIFRHGPCSVPCLARPNGSDTVTLRAEGTLADRLLPHSPPRRCRNENRRR